MLAPTTIVMVDVPEPGAGMVAGLNVTVVPLGTPEAESAIAALNPPLTDVVIVDVPWLPSPIVSDDGEAETVKLPLVVTVSVVLPWMVPEVAITVEVPAETPVASPPLAMVATDVLLELQVAVVVRF